MYWFVYAAIIGSLIIVSIIQSRNSSDGGTLTPILAFILGMSGFIIGIDAPNLYIIGENGEITVKKYCIPHYYSMNDGTRLFLHLGKTYIINEYGLDIYLEKVHYNREGDCVGKPVEEYSRDTVNTAVLKFDKKNVSPFEEPPASLERDGEKIICITAIWLEGQDFEPYDGKYRSLYDCDDDDWYLYSYANY